MEDLSIYFDFTHAKGVHLTRFLDYARFGFFAPFLGETMVASANGKSLYRGFTAGMRKRFSRGFQFEWNYTFAKDQDDDSNERDPFTDRAFDINNLQLDYALADRDIRHRFNFYANFDLPWAFEFSPRVQARTAQPSRRIATPPILPSQHYYQANGTSHSTGACRGPARFGRAIRVGPDC